MNVYREGERIRQPSGGGYSDRVSDDEICTHIARSLAELADDAIDERDSYFAVEHIIFARAVLKLRAAERVEGADEETQNA